MKRREFLAGGTAAAMLLSAARGSAAELNQFQLGVITDEVTMDFEKALVWAKDFGLEWVELRFLWGHYVTDLTKDEVQQAQALLHKYGMRVSVVDSAYFKTLLPGTDSKFADKKDHLQSASYEKQAKLLEHAFARAKDFGTDKVRIFSFLRVEEPKAVFDAVSRQLEKTADIAAKEKIRLVLENEHTCNVATGVESGAILDAVKSPWLGLNWDPGNAYAAGELEPYPVGYNAFDKSRLWHMHLKDAQPGTNGAPAWRPVGGGKIDYVGQFRALLKDNYTGTMSLETHYENAAHNKEESSRESMQGLLDVIRNA